MPWNKKKTPSVSPAPVHRITFSVQPDESRCWKTILSVQWQSKKQTGSGPIRWHCRQNQTHSHFKEARRGVLLLKITPAINYNRSSSLFHNMKEGIQVRSPRVVPFLWPGSTLKMVRISGGPVVEQRLFAREVQSGSGHVIYISKTADNMPLFEKRSFI